MDERKQVSELAIKNFSVDEPSPFDNSWYDITQKRTHQRLREWLKNKIKAKTLILNAGSGGADYGIKDGVMIHLDIVEGLVNVHEKYLVASIDCIPCDDNLFDIVICVGSVLNYADVFMSIKELSRVLKPSGVLILEFERSNSAEFLFTKNQNKNVVFCDSKYGEQYHKFWIYDEKFVCNILENYDMKIKKKYRFHVVSALVFRITKSEKMAAAFAFLDHCCSFFSYRLAHNVMFYLTKNAITI